MAVSIRTKRWTLAELHRLPEDGNKYEVVRGELYVTPPPTDAHETIAARLSAILTPYVSMHRLGYVYHPRAVMRFAGSEVEPDLFVRRAHPDRRGDDSDWTRAPTPILIVEILSPYTRRRDRGGKRGLYMEAGVAEYWVVDSEDRSITVITRRAGEQVVRETVLWHPIGGVEPLTVAVDRVLEP